LNKLFEGGVAVGNPPFKVNWKADTLASPSGEAPALAGDEVVASLSKACQTSSVDFVASFPERGSQGTAVAVRGGEHLQ
jgi:hypothetical protein